MAAVRLAGVVYGFAHRMGLQKEREIGLLRKRLVIYGFAHRMGLQRTGVQLLKPLAGDGGIFGVDVAAAAAPGVLHYLAVPVCGL